MTMIIKTRILSRTDKEVLKIVRFYLFFDSLIIRNKGFKTQDFLKK